jgi:hypothetical protein
VIPRPAHLGRRYGSQSEDETVARAYHTRPPYPAESCLRWEIQIFRGESEAKAWPRARLGEDLGFA